MVCFRRFAQGTQALCPPRPLCSTAPRPPAPGAGIATRLAAWLLPVVLVALLLPAGGCGYSQDVPTLPKEAHSLALAPVINQTATGELDVRLQALLRRAMLGVARVRLAESAEADLVLTVELTRFDVQRGLDSANLGLRRSTYQLDGLLTLTDQRDGSALLNKLPLSSTVQRYDPVAIRETPGVSYAHLDALLAQFSEHVRRRVLESF